MSNISKPSKLENGTVEWRCLNGDLHREDGPAIEYANGSKEWYEGGKLHRVGGPAVESCDGTRYWYLSGQLHRSDGPAVELFGGTRLYFYVGKQVDEEYFLSDEFKIRLVMED